MEGIAIGSLEPGTTLVVHTHNSQYRLIVLFDPCLVVVKGGTIFTEATVVRLAGAIVGGSALKIGWVLVGLGIEFQHGRRRIISSPVRSVSIERIPAMTAA